MLATTRRRLGGILLYRTTGTAATPKRSAETVAVGAQSRQAAPLASRIIGAIGKVD